MNYLGAWAELRLRRKQKLNASDWTQMPDNSLSVEKKAEWATYRQALRDIPQQFPDDVDKESTNPFEGGRIFPIKPD